MTPLWFNSKGEYKQIMDTGKFLRDNRVRIAFTIIGAAGGFLYWKLVGCKTGSCPIKSVWYWSTLYGIILGYLLGDIISGWLSKKSLKDKASSSQEGSQQS